MFPYTVIVHSIINENSLYWKYIVAVIHMLRDSVIDPLKCCVYLLRVEPAFHVQDITTLVTIYGDSIENDFVVVVYLNSNCTKL